MITQNYSFQNSEGLTMFADIEANIDELWGKIQLPSECGLLATRGLVVFPNVITPIHIGRSESMALVKQAERKGETICIACQLNNFDEVPTTKNQVAVYGVVARVIKVMELPGVHKQYTALVHSICRCKIDEVKEGKKWPIVDITPAQEDRSALDTQEFKASVDYLKQNVSEYIRKNEEIPDQAVMGMQNGWSDEMALNYFCTNIPLQDIKTKLQLLAEDSLLARAMKMITQLKTEIRLLDIKLDIQNRTITELADEQREYFLQQQMRNIKEELSGGEYTPEQATLKKKAKKKKWSEEVKKVFEEEFDRLDIIHPHSGDYSTQVQYLQTLVDLPWNEFTKDNLSLQRAEKILNRDHYGMEKVKERILEYMAVLSLKKDMKSPILCLYGPPGVGKTSLGKSIAASLGRRYVRMSLGGVHDESEIRGHRRTYIGAMPGRIIKSILKAGSSNPVIVLDEIDKLGGDTLHGDPSSALLEVLDPEQNNAFHDNYLDIDYDLSKVFFIATCNDLGTIPAPLRDRMEVIEVSGYITEEKLEIAKRHLVPRQKKNNGLDGEKKLQLDKAALEKIIEQYTRESGVRQLEKQINKAMRKLALKKAMEVGQKQSTSQQTEVSKPIDADLLPAHLDKITPQDIEGLLGKPPFYRDIYQGNDYAGVVTGLAWTSVGGEILFIETSLSKGKQQKLTLTGNLGDVMKESAVLALEFVKAHSELLNIDYRIFDHWNIHIHVPEGATPKDGPSAGITIATSIASALTQRKVKKNTAMTGEITLRGKVLPVGGIKEKILAAKRAGITDIIMCQENCKDVEDIAQEYLKGLTFHYVENVKDVWSIALTDEKVKDPVTFDIPEEQSK